MRKERSAILTQRSQSPEIIAQQLDPAPLAGGVFVDFKPNYKFPKRLTNVGPGDLTLAH